VQDLLKHLTAAFAFIDAGLCKSTHGSPEADAGVLVHCEQGVSRSAAACVAYIMRSKPCTLDQALREVRGVRRCVAPNAGFLRQVSSDCEIPLV